MSTTLILGGGFGGLACARALAARAPRSHRILLVDRSRDFLVGAAKTWVMLGERRAEEAVCARSSTCGRWRRPPCRPLGPRWGRPSSPSSQLAGSDSIPG